MILLLEDIGEAALSWQALYKGNLAPFKPEANAFARTRLLALEAAA